MRAWARRVAAAAIIVATGCYQRHVVAEDAGLAPCTIPIGTSAVTLGDRSLTMRSYAWAEDDRTSFAAFMDGSDVFIPPDEDGCGFGYGVGSRPGSGYEVFVSLERAGADCNDLVGQRRLAPERLCPDGGCAYVNLVECLEGADLCNWVEVESGELSAFIEGGERPSLCARATARTSDGRELSLEVHADLALCWRC